MCLPVIASLRTGPCVRGLTEHVRSRLQRTWAGYAVGLSAVLVVLGCLVLASASVQAQDTASPLVTYPLPDIAVQAPIGDLDESGIDDADDRCPTLPGDLLNGCQRDLNADVRAAWRVNRYYSRLLSLTVRAPIGSRIELRCRARSEDTCRFEKYVEVRGTVKLLIGARSHGTAVHGRWTITAKGERRHGSQASQDRRGRGCRVRRVGFNRECGDSVAVLGNAGDGREQR